VGLWVLRPSNNPSVDEQTIFTPKEVRHVHSHVTNVLTVFFWGGGGDNNGVVHYEIVPQSQTVNQHHYTTLNYTLQCPQEMHDKNYNFSTTTMHLLTLLCLCLNLWLESK